MDHPYAEIKIRFLAPDEGGRKSLPDLDDAGYRPHLRIVGDNEYLGVEFVDGPSTYDCSSNCHTTVRFLYSPQVCYDGLQVGSQIEVMEGGKVVAKGEVIRRG